MKADKNRFTEYTYGLALIILTMAVCGWYMNCVMAAENRTDMKDYITFFVLVLLLIWIGFCSSQYRYRNCFSLITIVLIPVLLFDSFDMWRYEPVVRWGSLVGMLFSLMAGISLVWVKVKRWTNGMPERRMLLEAVLAAARILWCIILVTIVIYGRNTMKDGVKAIRDIPYNISGTENNIEDAENSMENNIEVLSRLDSECGWDLLPLEGKMGVLESVIRVECRHLGMRDVAPTLVIGYLEEESIAEYNYMTDIVKLSYKYLIDQKNNGYAVVEALCEELFYRYQAYMAYIPGFDHDVNSLANALRYEPSYSSLTRAYAEKEYGKEREATYRNAIWNYLADI